MCMSLTGFVPFVRLQALVDLTSISLHGNVQNRRSRSPPVSTHRILDYQIRPCNAPSAPVRRSVRVLPKPSPLKFRFAIEHHDPKR